MKCPKIIKQDTRLKKIWGKLKDYPFSSIESFYIQKYKKRFDTKDEEVILWTLRDCLSIAFELKGRNRYIKYIDTLLVDYNQGFIYFVSDYDSGKLLGDFPSEKRARQFINSKIMKGNKEFDDFIIQKYKPTYCRGTSKDYSSEI